MTGLGILTVAVLVPFGLPVASAAGTSFAAKPAVCLPFSATGQGRDVSDGSGPTMTAGTLSVSGYRIGSTKATFDITGAVGTTVSFAGPLTFKPDYVHGSLTAALVGALDLSDPPESTSFTASSTSVSGSGALRGVTGQIDIRGVQDLVQGGFTETLTGRLCAPPSHKSGLVQATAPR